MDRFTPDYVLFGGDLNLALDVQLDRFGSLNNNVKAANVVNNYLSNTNCIDVWRLLKPDIAGYTWRRHNPRISCSRLDYLFVSETLMQYLESVVILPGYRTDHSIVVCTIEFCFETRGPGYWKLNTSLLRDPEYVSKMNALIDIEMANENYKSKTETWECLKLAIQGSSVQYATKKKKSDRNKLEVLEK